MYYHYLDYHLNVTSNEHLIICSDRVREDNIHKGELLVSGVLWWIDKTYVQKTNNQIGVNLFECQLLESFGKMRSYHNVQLLLLAKGVNLIRRLVRQTLDF